MCIGSSHDPLVESFEIGFTESNADDVATNGDVELPVARVSTCFDIDSDCDEVHAGGSLPMPFAN